jgi:hypothetical protein
MAETVARLESEDSHTDTVVTSRPLPSDNRAEANI